MRASNSVIRFLLVAVLAGGCVAQTITVTSPANGGIVSNTNGEWLLKAAVSNMPNLARVAFYTWNRLECVATSASGGVWACPFNNEPWTDYYSVPVYARAFDWTGAPIATSPTVTFGIRNHGLTAVNSFNQSVTGNITGNLIWTPGNNATTVTTNYPGGGPAKAIDGVAGVGAASYTDVTNINTSNSEIMFPVMPFYTGQQFLINLRKKSSASVMMQTFPGCSGTGCPGGGTLLDQETVYAVVVDGNHMRIADTLAHASSCASGTISNCITLTSQGDPEGMIGLSGSQSWYTQGGAFSETIDTTQFLNGMHRFDSVIQGSTANAGISGTLNIASTSVNVSGNSIAATNHPFTEGMSVALTAAGTLPGGITSPCTIHVIDANDFSCQGQTITSQGSGTNTATFTSTVGQFDTTACGPGCNGYNDNPIVGSDTTELNFQNPSTASQLWPQYGRVWVAPGENVTMTIQYVNTDYPTTGATTAVTASSLLYGSEDSTIASVTGTTSTTLTITGTNGGATPPKETWITIIDPAKNRTAKVLVTLVTDHTHFKHFSVGHGILSTYTPGQSIFSISGFNTDPTVPCSIPNPYSSPSAAFLWAGIPVVEGVHSYNGWLSASSYSTWLSAWQGASSGCNGATQNLATITSELTVNGSKLPGLAFTTGLCGGYNPLYNTPWIQQAWSKMFNDLAPYQISNEVCDETDSHFGPIAKPAAGFGSGTDGVNYGGGCTSTTCGLQSITVTGCPATPCTGTAEVSFPTYDLISTAGGGKPIYIWGATNTALNGGYWIPRIVTFSGSAVSVSGNSINANNHHLLENEVVSLISGSPPLPGGLTESCTINVIDANDFNCQGRTITSTGSTSATISAYTVVPDWSDKLSSADNRTVSFAFQTRNVVNGTYNAATDAGLNLANMCAGYFCTYNPKSSCALGASGCASQIVVSGTSCSTSVCTATFLWTAHGLSTGRVLGLTTFTSTAWRDPSGQPGLYPITVTDANDFTIPVVNVPAGTYTSSTDPSATIQVNFDPSSEIPQGLPYLMAKTWITGVKPPFGWPQLAGGDTISTLGYANVMDYNSIYQSWQGNDTRFGSYAYDNYAGPENYGNELELPMGLRAPGLNYFVDGPYLFEVQLTHSSCNLSHHPDFRCYYNAGIDTYNVGDNGPGQPFIQSLMGITTGLSGGIRAYGLMTHYFKAVVNYSATATAASPRVGTQTAVDYIDSFPDNLMAGAEVWNFANRNLHMILAPPCNPPYEGELVFTGCRKDPSSGEMMYIFQNLSEDVVVRPINLASLELGGPVRKEMLTMRGTVITSLSPTAMSDTCTMGYAQACVYFFQTTGANDELTFATFAFNAAQYGASKVALEIHYYPQDDPSGVYDCSSGCTVPVNLNGAAPVWYRHAYLAANGSVLARSDLQRFK